jgi:hypothetical protein
MSEGNGGNEVAQRRAVAQQMGWLAQYGVTFSVKEMGAENDLGETVFEKKPRLIMHNLPVFLISAPEFAFLRKRESMCIEYVKAKGDADVSEV